MKKICKHCKMEFEIENKPKGWFANHSRWCDKNPKRNIWNKGVADCKKSGAEKHKKNINNYLENPKFCVECNNMIDYTKKRNKFCSSRCAALYNNKRKDISSWQWTEERKENNKKRIDKYKKLTSATRISFCKNCNMCYEGKNLYCSSICRKTFITDRANKEKKDLELYRYYSKFKFNLDSFRDKFDFSLIEKYGWYKAKNRGNNLNGVTRDHIISVRYGFDNNIPTWIISHPANCELMRFSDNSSKHSNCNLTLDELLIKIEKW